LFTAGVQCAQTESWSLYDAGVPEPIIEAKAMPPPPPPAKKAAPKPQKKGEAGIKKKANLEKRNPAGEACR
jgi:hypothetical protein